MGNRTIEEIRQTKRLKELAKRLKELVPYKVLAPDAEEIVEELERLNNIINRIDNFVDRTIEVIKQQPSDNDEWILERLNGIKHLIEIKENK